MKRFLHLLPLSTRVYTAACLTAAVLAAPAPLSWVPGSLLFWYLLSWRWRISVLIRLLTDYLAFFAAALLLQPFTAHSWLFSLPMLVLLEDGLRASGRRSRHVATEARLTPTRLCLALFLIAVAVLLAAGLFASTVLLYASLIALAYLAARLGYSWRLLRTTPVVLEAVDYRMLAGSDEPLTLEPAVSRAHCGRLFLAADCDWVKVRPAVVELSERLAINLRLKPALAGPATVKLRCHMIDPWGLLQRRFELEAVRLTVIPRARYASWLARRYLDSNYTGALPVVSDFGALKAAAARGSGEYCGSRPYQPGDRLKAIDWKHSLKSQQLVSRRFADALTRPAVLWVNLAAADSRDADELAYKLLVAALTLAREGIPAAIAAYDHNSVILASGVLAPRQLVAACLRLTQRITGYAVPVSYLARPDVFSLRANLTRLGGCRTPAALALSELLKLEMVSLKHAAGSNPAAQALQQCLAKAGRAAGMVIVSRVNHDAAAIAFHEFAFRRRGDTVIKV